MESPLDKKTLLRSILRKGRLKIKNARKGETPTTKPVKQAVGSKINKRLVSKLKPKESRFGDVEREGIKASKQLAAKTRRAPSGFKARPAKNNYIDRDTASERLMERLTSV